MAGMYDKDLQKVWKVGVVTQSGNATTPYAHPGAPTSSNDSSQGYHIGDFWITVSNTIYMCCVDTVGAAVWTQIG